ncbi:O-antigen ligase family protein [Paenibacillus pasadenensis]|uniref:O-antigen ligase family protein n=1 Tax=Paenibacillus pasadenensis TaxID=217090 RepID=UPI00041EE61A|nr:O-antigen ligase family protein [Paenibacillus pasadenensis]
MSIAAARFPLQRERISFAETLTIPLLGLTIFVQSVVVGGINISLSDVWLFMILFFAVAELDRLRLRVGYLFASGAYLAWCSVSFFWAGDVMKSFAPFVQFFEFMVAGVIVFGSLTQKTSVIRILKFYAVMATMLGLASVLFAIATRSFSALYFLDYHKNALGAIVGNNIPLLVGLLLLPEFKRRRVWIIAALSISSLSLLITTSRGSMLGAIVGVCILFFLIYRVRLVVLFATLGAGLFWLYTRFIAPDYLESFTRTDQFSSAYSRVTIYNDVWAKIQEAPMLGHGLGNYFIEIIYLGFRQNDPNNVFLLNLVEIGLVGLVLFIVLMAYFFVQALKNRRAFRSNANYLVLSATLFGCFVSQLAHIQVDVSWLRGTGLFMFGCGAMMLCLPHLKEERT